MNNTRTIVEAVLAAGSTATPFFYEVSIKRCLCRNTCAESAPLFTPVFTSTGIESLGGSQYLISVHVEGVLHYSPCGSGQYNTKAETVSEDFVIPYYGAAAPASVTITAGTTVNVVETAPCKDCGRVFVSKTPISVAIG